MTITRNSRNLTLGELDAFATRWSGILLEKGYKLPDAAFYIDPTDDRVRIDLEYYNTHDAIAHLDSDLRWCTLDELGDRLAEIETWLNALEREEADRERKLLEDFARIKDRIASSNLSDMIKQEATNLMKMLTTNIIEDHRPRH